VTRIDPARAGAFVNLGAVLNLLGQLDEAVTALRRGIQLDGQRVEGYYNLGLVYKRKNQADMALTAYREAVRINPRMADAHLNMANLYMEKEQPRMALKHYEQALQVRPNWDKALDGMASAQAVLAGEAEAEEGEEPAEGSSHTVRAAAAPGGDMDRMVDPVVHATFLSTLHQATIVAEDTGRLLQKIVVEEVEPVIAELSRVLLNTGGSRSELDACVTKFETALNRMRTAHEVLKGSVVKIDEIGEKFPTR
jgi:tetratricopeptide (TPR) repeat protein